jgi:UDP-N-acetylglucosamine 2-epimerase (non-hydrolysing)
MHKNTRLKVMTVVGTRPELIRLSRVIFELDRSFEHVLVHTGQNFDDSLSKVFFEDLSIRNPDYYLDCASEAGSTAATIANILSEVDRVLETENPDAFLVLGDTNSCLSALVAKKRQIPVFHMEAGNRCFDERVPEETNRKIVDHIADVNLPYSAIARQYLLDEGLPADLIIKTGSPMAEVIEFALPGVKNSNILNELGLRKEKYFVVSAHREENVGPDSMFEKLIDTLNLLASEYELPVIVSTHPKLRKKITASKLTLNNKIQFLNPLGYLDYLSLQMNSLAVLSDSGTISEESAILNFSALNLREAHERPEAMEEANVMMVGLDPTHVLNCLHLLLESNSNNEHEFNIPRDYRDTNISKKVARIIQSYTPYVNRRKWANKGA